MLSTIDCPSNRDLCERYDVRIYRAEDLPGRLDSADVGKFIVTTNADDFTDLSNLIPAGCSEEDAERLAVEALNLQELFRRETAAGKPLARLVHTTAAG